MTTLEAIGLCLIFAFCVGWYAIATAKKQE